MTLAQIAALCCDSPDPGAKVDGAQGVVMREEYNKARDEWIDEQVRAYG